MRTSLTGVLGVAGLLSAAVAAQEPSMDDLLKKGDTLFHAQVGCWVCHGPQADGLVGPSLHFGPTPTDIYAQLESNPMMAPVMTELNPTDEDLVGVALYIRTLAGLPLDPSLPEEWMEDMAAVRAAQANGPQFTKTAYDLKVEAVESFGSVLTSWERRAKTGNIKSDYDAKVVKTWDAGQPKFKPKKNHMYFYENLGVQNTPQVFFDGYTPPNSNQIVVGDAHTKRVLASYELPVDLKSAVHTSAVSPDGKYVYIVGPRAPGSDGKPDPTAPTTMIKADALTLQPIKQITIGARLHHVSVFQDKYLLMDMFARDPDGLAVLLYDANTDKVLGGIKDVDLGGFGYTAFSDDEYIYIGVEPAGYAPGRATGMVGVTNLYHGKLQAMRPFWIAKIDPKNWEVVREYPVPGYRPNWIVIDDKKEYMYVVMASTAISKVNLATGVVEWTGASGIGPYGATLNADESQLWIADKGEGAGHMGRTVTVLDTERGEPIATLFGAYKADHVLLSPNGKEMWSTSNAEGRIYVYDAKTREHMKVIEMPQNGDAHGLIWVYYDNDLNARVVRDQGGFHNGINPVEGKIIDY
jgi:DNA-binding beta-propeller fold protein YncE/mono/diheme cytochrome c family protein